MDVPSGVDSDTGAVAGAAIRAAVTVTFGAYKRGLLIAPGAFHTGHIELIDIGISPHLPVPDLTALETADAARLLPTPGPTDSKYTRGVVGVVAGSPAYTGAAVLASGSAALAGSGMVRFVSAAHPAEIVRNAHPEVVITVIEPGDAEGLLAAGQVQAWVVGPGMGTGDDAARLVAAVLGTDLPVLVDADALTILSRDPGLVRGRQAPTLLTPHAGEYGRLTGVDAQELAADRLRRRARNRGGARRHGAAQGQPDAGRGAGRRRPRQSRDVGQTGDGGQRRRALRRLRGVSRRRTNPPRRGEPGGVRTRTRRPRGAPSDDRAGLATVLAGRSPGHSALQGKFPRGSRRPGWGPAYRDAGALTRGSTGQGQGRRLVTIAAPAPACPDGPGCSRTPTRTSSSPAARTLSSPGAWRAEPPGRLRAEARIDLDAVRTSTAELVRRAGGAEVMAVVKADGYGHGMLPCAQAALEAGATWLGTSALEEGLALRAAGIDAPILSWLAAPGEPLAAGVAAGIDLSASAEWMLDELAGAAHQAGRPARVHLKADTGLHRAGALPGEWPALVAAALRREAAGEIDIVGLWSHFAWADAPGHPTIARQIQLFAEAVETAERAGVHPQVRHLANSAATLTLPAARFDLVRPGISVYGLSPGPDVGTARELGLVPAMTFLARVALAKHVPPGSGVSYGHRYVTAGETALALVPVGYADGVPRNAGNKAEVLLGGRRRRIAGTVCMDQFVLDVGADEVVAGDDVVLFGPGTAGEPTAQEWAEALDTICYEVVSRIGMRVPRTYVGQATVEQATVGQATVGQAT